MAHTTATSVLSPTTRVASPVRILVTVVAASLFVALCAHVSVPLFFTPVPITLQPFAVLVVGLLLEPIAAFSALALYLLEGAVGMPVFTPQGPGGMLQLLGPTGGYLMSYPFVAAFIGFLMSRFNKRSYGIALFSAAAGDALILAAGTIWLASVTHQAITHTISLSVVPFLAGDALKVCIAAAIASGWSRLRKIEEPAGR
jgi:biotin transport system substrate-specific component